jgi:hypothetical protein
MVDAPDNVIPLEIPPGFLKTTTPLAGKGRFTDGDKVRFPGGQPEKWKGWRKFIDDQLTGIARGAGSWTNQYGNSNIAIGTHLKLYAITGDDTLIDITPIRASSVINTNPFAIPTSTQLITVTDTAFGGSAGDFVTYSGAITAYNMNREFQIVEKLSADTYTIDYGELFTTQEKSLLNFDGVDASTTFTDTNNGAGARIWTAVGNAQLDTADKKWGTASLLCDGTGDCITTPDTADIELSTGDWTIECWFKCNVATGTARAIYGRSDAGFTAAASSLVIRRDSATDFIKAYVSDGSTFAIVTSTTGYTSALNTGWHHIALVRSGNVLKMFLDGVQEGGNVAFTGTLPNLGAVWCIGARTSAAADSWLGWIDGFRLVVGTARYTANFTPPTGPWGTPAGGAAVTAAYQINVGSPGTVYGLGWGAGPWGIGTWSTERTEGIPIDGRYWSVVEYGNDLLASPSLGGLYLWQEATDDRAEVVAGAPTSMRAMFVTGERFIFALGTTTGMTVQWPDVDDLTDWTPAPGNTANSRTLQSGGRLIAGCPLTDGLNLVWSDTSLYIFQKVETDFIYDSRMAGSNCGLIGQGAFCRVSGVAFWMSGQLVHMYAQGVQSIPNFEDIRSFVFEDMDAAQTSKVWCQYDQKNNQVRWGYCSNGATEPDKYFDVSLDGRWIWTTGTLDRTTGTLYRPAQALTLMVDSDSYVWAHDVGVDDGDNAMEAYLTYGLYVLTRGEVNVDITNLVPDCERQVGLLDYEIFTKDRTEDAANLEELTLSVNPGTGLAECRVAGRHFGMTIRSNSLGGDFRFGTHALELGPSGERP